MRSRCQNRLMSENGSGADSLRSTSNRRLLTLFCHPELRSAILAADSILSLATVYRDLRERPQVDRHAQKTTIAIGQSAKSANYSCRPLKFHVRCSTR